MRFWHRELRTAEVVEYDQGVAVDLELDGDGDVNVSAPHVDVHQIIFVNDEHRGGGT